MLLSHGSFREIKHSFVIDSTEVSSNLSALFIILLFSFSLPKSNSIASRPLIPMTIPKHQLFHVNEARFSILAFRERVL